MDTTTHLLTANKLTKHYGHRIVVNEVSFSIKPGEIVGLLGPNGAGKTTAFYMAIGLIRPDKGQILLNGQDVTQLPIDQRAKMGMGYLAQEPSIFRSLSVQDNILCILETLNLSKQQREQRLNELLSELHLIHLKAIKASKLSGGERRRLEIARALVTNPKLLLLDEPFANVDPITVSDLQKMICILKEKGISILITDHNAREIFSIVDRSYLVYEGKLIAEGPIDTILQNEDVKRFYLGHNFKL